MYVEDFLSVSILATIVLGNKFTNILGERTPGNLKWYQAVDLNREPHKHTDAKIARAIDGWLTAALVYSRVAQHSIQNGQWVRHCPIYYHSCIAHFLACVESGEHRFQPTEATVAVLAQFMMKFLTEKFHSSYFKCFCFFVRRSRLRDWNSGRKVLCDASTKVWE